MNFTVTGADKKSGNDVELTLTASSLAEAERIAAKRGVLVSSVKPKIDGTGIDDAMAPIELWAEGPTSTGPGTAAARAQAAAAASAPDSAPAPAATAASALANSRYHVVQNPALYLLELAVNKHLRDGWNPLGGIQVSMVNNQLLFYQALVRDKAESEPQAH